MSSSNNGIAKEFATKRRTRLWKCDRCPAHRKENAERTPRRSWKFRSRKAKPYL